jgi:membrane-associated phospholipid phosphatase
MRSDTITAEGSAAGPTSIVLAALAVISCAGLAHATGVRLAFGDGSLRLIALFLALRVYVGWRMPELRRLMLLTETILLLLVASCAIGFLSYFAPMAAMPLRDAELRALDLAMGFDWVAVVKAADLWPRLGQILALVYATLPAQLMAVVIVLTIARQREELDQFVITFLVTSLTVIAVSALVPAVGPTPTLLHAPLDTLRLDAAWGSPGIVQALREGAVREIDLGKLAGIVTFPSFHTVVALIVPWALRGVPLAFWPALVTNVLMLASTFTEGGHYLVDVIAGAMVALGAIGFARFAARSIDPVLRRMASRLIWGLSLPVRKTGPAAPSSARP